MRWRQGTYRTAVVAHAAASVSWLGASLVLLFFGVPEQARALDPGRLAAVDGGVIAGPIVSSLVYLSLIAVTYVRPWRRGRARRGSRVPARSAR